MNLGQTEFIIINELLNELIIYYNIQRAVECQDREGNELEKWEMLVRGEYRYRKLHF